MVGFAASLLPTSVPSEAVGAGRAGSVAPEAEEVGSGAASVWVGVSGSVVVDEGTIVGMVVWGTGADCVSSGELVVVATVPPQTCARSLFREAKSARLAVSRQLKHARICWLAARLNC
jgi:hypothetical protein